MSNAPDMSGDNDDLEALFDSIVAGNASDGPATESLSAAGSQASESCESREEKVYHQIGNLTRKLHDTLRELGYDKKLEDAVATMPDARDRLNYISTMTAQAAERVLNATDVAKPIQDKIESQAVSLSAEWDKLFNKELGVDEFKALVGRTRDYLKEVPQHTQTTSSQLMEIMMAQDFQDLTGQVIRRVVDMAQKMEQDMLQLLLMTAPPEKVNSAPTGLLNGPVINAEGRTDVVTTQEQVDDLLESLGF